jgi:hypothetical protein
MATGPEAPVTNQGASVEPPAPAAAGPAGTAAPPAQQQLPGAGAAPPANAAQPAGDDDGPDSHPKPDDKGIIKLSMRDFMKRVRKSTKRELRDAGLPTDIEALRAYKKSIDEWEKTKEADRQAKLSETQKLQEERDRALERAAEADRRAERARDRVRRQRVERSVRQTAMKYINPERVERAMRDLAGEINSMSSRRQRKLRSSFVDDYMKKLAADPYFARASTQAAPEPAAPEQAPAEPPAAAAPAPLTSGAPGKPDKPRPAPVNSVQSGLWNGKTTRPGQPNSMTREELRQYAERNHLPLP